jgi:Domain of unknown function (DUF4382)
MNSLEGFGVVTFTAILLTGCGGGSSGGSSVQDDSSQELIQETTGAVSISITDGPSEEASELVLHFTHIELGREDGHVERIPVSSGSGTIDLMGLQNGNTAMLVEEESMPVGRYEWLELGVDIQKSHLQLQNGATHGMRMGDGSTTRVDVALDVAAGSHSEYVLDIDARRSIIHHDARGMMAEEYDFHPNMRFVEISQTGSIGGTVDMSMIDAYQDGCDSAEGGNWAYLYHGDVMEPDDFSENESDTLSGPIAMDRVEMDSESGAYHYQFSYLPEGMYRIAFSCSAEWDESGDDDYPGDPDGRFSFHGFSGALEVKLGEMTEHHMKP